MNGSVEAKYVFLDVVTFSSRSVEAQAIVVRSLNRIVAASLGALKLRQRDSKKVLCIPTGDGMCIVLIMNRPKSDREIDVHIRLAREILTRLSKHNQKIREPEEAFKVRIGVNENRDISVIDINGRRNIAGAGINDAARIMDMGGGSQILVGQNVYERLRVRRKYQGAFKPYRVRIKHGREMAMYQFAPENLEGSAVLDITEPPSITQRDRSRRDSDLVLSEGLIYDAMRGLMKDAQSNIVVATTKRDWVYALIPSIILARIKKLKVFVIHYPDSATDENRGEMRLLQELGCIIVEKNPKLAAPFEGALTDVGDEAFQVRGLVLANKPDVAGFYGRKLYARGDLPLLNALESMLKLKLNQKPSYTPTVRAVSVSQAIAWVKKVPLYQNCRVTLQNIEVKTVRPVAPDLRLFKIRQADAIRELLKRCDVAPYGPAVVTLKNGKKSPILPPVLEEHEGVLCIAEGHNRLYSSLRLGQKVQALIVTGLAKAFQRPTSLWQDIRVDDDRISSGLGPEARAYARNIESSVHQRLY